MREEVELLEDHARVRENLPRLGSIGVLCRAVLIRIGQELALDLDGARVNRLELVDAAQERALARAGRPDDREDLAAADLHIDALEHSEVAERLVDIVHAQHDLRFITYRICHSRPPIS